MKNITKKEQIVLQPSADNLKQSKSLIKQVNDHCPYIDPFNTIIAL